MGNGVNKVTLIGNLGQDPELRHTGGGTSVANLRVACNERRKVGGEWTDATEWISVVVFGKTAENCAEFLQKGRQVYVDGRMQTRSWEDKDGNKRSTTEVVANQVLFLSSDRGGSGRGDKHADERGGIDDQEIPF